jgi:flagellar motility protein MotE (MotC chaperone)
MDQAAKGGREAPGEPAGRVKRLARLYEGMRAKEAAAVLERLERPLAMRILSLLSERQAGKILSAMNPSAAAEVSRLLGQATLEREVRAHEQ